MKNICFILLIVIAFTNITYAKKVKFAVDMGTYTINPLGIHVMGDFQTIAGFTGGDFNPASTMLTQEGSSTIYSIIVDLPAFAKYEFKFVNGDQSYEAEVVPDQARVGYNFDDNRWIYVDSLQNDTTNLGAVLFNGNAPAGKTLIRFVVDMQNAGTINTNGVHVAGNFQSFDPSKIRLYSFGNNIFEIITYMDSNGIKEFKYFNGNTSLQTETVPSACATSGNRTTNVVKDSILVTVCYNECVACVPNGLKANTISYQSLNIYPNPASTIFYITNEKTATDNAVIITDITGKKVKELQLDSNQSLFNIDVNDLNKGVYQVYLRNNKEIKHTKLIIN